MSSVSVLHLLLVSSAALLLDRLLGEPAYHPLIWFGRVASKMETRFNGRTSRRDGILVTLVLVAPLVTLVWTIQLALSSNPLWRMLFDTLILWLGLGWQSMKEHTQAVYLPLKQHDLDTARTKLSLIVSRQTTSMNETDIVGATMESVLENGHDCLFASLFWYAVLGPVGVLLHRLINTLDAMWGYKNPRFVYFGYFAARSDDWLGWLPARLTAFSYACCGAFGTAWKSAKAQTGKHKSPNAGLVMASGAGALRCRIGGPAMYDGMIESKPYLGCGPPASLDDIRRSIVLIEKSLFLWLACLAVLAVLGVWF